LESIIKVFKYEGIYDKFGAFLISIYERITNIMCLDYVYAT